MRRDVPIVLGLLAAAVICVDAAKAQISDDVVRIGVLNDQSNVYADLGGPGSVIAARMAIEDVGGKVLGKPINLLVADHQSKADIGASIARQWAGTDEAKAVMAKMRAIPVNDFYAKNGRVREDGRMVHDMYFVQVKTPEESTGPWDYYKILSTIPSDQAFRPVDESGCPLVKQR